MIDKEKSNLKNKKTKKILLVAIIALVVSSILISGSMAYYKRQLESDKKYVITASNVTLVLDETSNDITIDNTLPQTDEDGMNNSAYTFSIENMVSDMTYQYTIYLEDNEIEDGATRVSDEFIKYYLTNDSLTTQKDSALLSSLSTDENGRILETGTIAGGTKYNYTLRFWVDYDATQTDAAGKVFSVKLNIMANQGDDYKQITNKLFISDNLGENCKTYDDGVDTFLVGDCQKNYVWYSGKLWRVVLKNNDTGAVKMVTDNAITAIAYNESGNSEFENSYVDQWLTQEFLPTLHNYENYLVVDSIWDATENSSSTPARPSYTTSVTRTVGLLNSYEYYTTYNNSDNLATSSTVYLSNKGTNDVATDWYLITPYDSSQLWSVYEDSLGYDAISMIFEVGVRPSINLKSEVKTITGDGTESNPYILEGDIQESVNGTTLLSTRYSGEYVTFNNELYRIVDVENGLTKITSVNNFVGTYSWGYNSEDEFMGGVYSFENSLVKSSLETYYQNLATSNLAAYNMIEPNTIWYLGDGFGNYKLTKCATENANVSMNDCSDKAESTTVNIGLPRIGEMFTSQITREEKLKFWVLNKGGGMEVAFIGATDAVLTADESYTTCQGARPSMYLKSNVVISSDNTGNGTYEHPYSLSMN